MPFPGSDGERAVSRESFRSIRIFERGKRDRASEETSAAEVKEVLLPEPGTPQDAGFILTRLLYGEEVSWEYPFHQVCLAFALHLLPAAFLEWRIPQDDDRGCKEGPAPFKGRPHGGDPGGYFKVSMFLLSLFRLRQVQRGGDGD